MNSQSITYVAQDKIDLSNVATFKSDIIHLADQPFDKILIDLSACEFIDSKGLSTLVTLSKSLGEVDKKLYLVGARGKVKRVLELTKLYDFFTEESEHD